MYIYIYLMIQKIHGYLPDFCHISGEKRIPSCWPPRSLSSRVSSVASDFRRRPVVGEPRSHLGKLPKGSKKYWSSGWLNHPFEKYSSNWKSSLILRVKIENPWNHHLEPTVIYSYILRSLDFQSLRQPSGPTPPWSSESLSKTSRMASACHRRIFQPKIKNLQKGTSALAKASWGFHSWKIMGI